MSSSLLFQEMFHLREVARLLKPVRRETLRYWLDGRRVRGRWYEPVVRPQTTGSDLVTWGEFVELACLREYRDADVPLQRLRPVIHALRAEFDVPYPLAILRPYVHWPTRNTVMEIQEQLRLPDQLRFLRRADNGQMVFATEFELYKVKVELADSADWPVIGFRPLGPESDVVIDPVGSYGAAVVCGLRTDAIAELVAAGEDRDDVRDWYHLTDQQLSDALRFEGVSSYGADVPEPVY